METNKEFMERVKEAVSLSSQTCRALAPESDEDISIYALHAVSETEDKK